MNKNIKICYNTGRGLNSYMELHKKQNMLYPDILVTACGTNIVNMNEFENPDTLEGFVSNLNYREMLSEFWKNKIVYDTFKANL